MSERRGVSVSSCLVSSSGGETPDWLGGWWRCIYVCLFSPVTSESLEAHWLLPKRRGGALMQPAKRTSLRDDGSTAGSGTECDLTSTSSLESRRSIDRPNNYSPRQVSVIFVCGEGQKENRSFDIGSLRRLASSAYFAWGGSGDPASSIAALPFVH